MSKTVGKIINTVRFCTDDGPGIRTVVFVKGCPLSCIWCHNPESQSFDNDIMFDSQKCVKCMRCRKICKNNCHDIIDGEHIFNIEKCSKCGKCVEVCPKDALKTFGQTISADEVFNIIRKDEMFYKTSGGGVTISGGEPLAQASFTSKILKLCKEHTIHTAIETAGFANESSLKSVLEYCDLVLFDIKESEEKKHLAFTGVSAKPILDNLYTVNEMRIPIILRLPIVPGLNDYENHFIKVKELAEKLDMCRKIEIMPYHVLGEYKYKLLQKPYCCANIKQPYKNTVRKWEDMLNITEMHS